MGNIRHLLAKHGRCTIPSPDQAGAMLLQPP
jgi:hypothetical protein